MKRKIGSIFFIMLVCTSLIIPVTSQTNTLESYELEAISGGFSPTTSLFKIQITVDGMCTYSVLYPEDRLTEEWTEIVEFELSENEKNMIWEKISSNDFFNLDEKYINSTILDGTFAELTITSSQNTHTVRTENTVKVSFDSIMKTINKVTPGDLDLFYNAIFNYQPNQPSQPLGPTEVKILKTYTFTTTSTDQNMDPLYYWFDWGDGTNSGWVGPFNSGDTGSADHKWTVQGNMTITVKAKDDPNGDGNLDDGIESDLSDPLIVSLPKFKINIFSSFHFLDRILQKIPYWKEIINIILGKEPLESSSFSYVTSQIDDETIEVNQILPSFTVNQPESQYTFETLAAGGGTRVEIKECAITVNIYIQIRGPGATVQVTKDIEKNIEDVWNGDWKVKCKEGCVPREPGCTVTFDAHVVRMPPGEFLPGFHDITIVNDNSADGEGHVSFVMGSRTADPNDRVLDSPLPNDGGTTTGEWDTNEPANTYAHEAGHLMGLDDTYPPHKNNFGDHIMNNNGAVRQEDIDLIVKLSGVECPCKCCPEEEDNEDPENHIIQPENKSYVSSPIMVIGEASDGLDGSGIAMLSYKLKWQGGTMQGSNYIIDPPLKSITYRLGPLYLEYFIEPDDWITITTYAYDAAGNVDADSITVTWVEGGEDTVPPVTEKIIGEPSEEGGYLIWPITPITLHATDDNSGVDYIHYEVWWDSNGDSIIDTQMADVDYNGETTIFHMLDYGIFFGFVELQWYAVDNAENVEEIHIQEHFVIEG